jgi:integrase
MTATAQGVDTPTLRQALEAYQDWRTRQARFSLRTWAGEKPGLLGFVDQIGCDRPVTEITDTDLDAWWDALTVADSTRKTRLAQLRSFLRYCTELRGWMDRDPSLLLRAGTVMPTQRQRLTRNELLALLDQARTPRDRILLALAMNLALRGSEIAGLRIRDVNLTAAEISVRIEKTGKADIMPITVELDVELKHWLRVYRMACPDLRPDSYLVPSQFFQPSTGKTTWRHAVKYAEPHRVVQAALEKLGWPSTLREGVHTIRRSVARVAYDMMVAEGDPEALMTTMRLLHHSNPEVTLRYIGYDRQTEARDRFLKRQRFLTRNTTVRPTAFAQ